MADRDFGSDLDAPPLLLQLKEWLTEDFAGKKPTPTLTEEPPICSLLSETPWATPAPPSGSPSVPAGLNHVSSRRSTSETKDYETKINIEYIFWTPAKGNPPPPEDTKYVKLPSEAGKIDIFWDIEELRFSEFKQNMRQAICKQDTKLGDHAKSWTIMKATIHNNHSFADFIGIVSVLGEESQKNIVLIERDPNTVTQASLHVTLLGSYF
ncbi:hypothetical protein VP01_849g3 [Puccinia sorghi]|uniref:Uncharacterized protein n=1 Tax=Puccinia sorghi TaxID=27349 RepID=A0A0L6U977_9BASI|nr:hypothetical protein VP01_849g3 [Puccinia sorghi]